MQSNSVFYQVFKPMPVLNATGEMQIVPVAGGPTPEAAMAAAKHLKLTNFAIVLSVCIHSTIDNPVPPLQSGPSTLLAR